MPVLIILSVVVLLAVSGCDKSVPGTDYMLSASQVESDTDAAERGDSEATKRLAFHFGLIGKKVLSQRYLSKCISMRNPECLAEGANEAFARYLDNSTSSDEKARYLSLAIKLNHEALVNADPQDLAKIRGYQAQGRTFLSEKAQ